MHPTPHAASFRRLDDRDGPGLRELFGAPDLGRVRIARMFHRDPVRTLQDLDAGSGGVVAEIGGRLVGSLLIVRGPLNWDGHARKGVYVSNVTVHPQFRRRGLARSLQRFALDSYADDVRDAIVYGTIQRSNQASIDMVAEHLGHSTPDVGGGVFSVRRMPVRASITVEELRAEGVEEFVEAMNAYFSKHQFWRSSSATELRERLSLEIDGHRPLRAFVGRRGGVPVTGLLLRDHLPLEQMQVFGLGWGKRMAGRVTGILDEAAKFRSLRVQALWCRPGESAAVGELLDTMRFRLRARGVLSCYVDAREAVASAVSARVRMYRSHSAFMTSEPGHEHGDRPIYKAH